MTGNQVKSAHCKCNALGVRFIELVTLSYYTSTPASSSTVSSYNYAVSTIDDVSYMGLFSMYSDEYNFCVPYQWFNGNPNPTVKDQMSSSIKAAEAFGAVAAVVGGVMTLSMLLTILFTGLNKCVWVTMASMLVANVAFQLLTFAAFNHELCKMDVTEYGTRKYTDCTMDEGAAYAVSAAIFYLLASIAMFCVPPPRTPLIGFEAGWRNDVRTITMPETAGNDDFNMEQHNKYDPEVAMVHAGPNYHGTQKDFTATTNSAPQGGHNDSKKHHTKNAKPPVEL